ncbi:MAG: hypothetical protein A3F67_05370 [Verrucomicrobia bacterium RIFCSPHIGHO2_12_FULL_41_10]|nr:MAG: hypothetical protein A3F67_05370 [Verrucomicrobia bacterium RIFCSPHIGHO2_12_FULL_41_10]
MANHPISMVSPMQVIQSSTIANTDKLIPVNASAVPTAGTEDKSTAPITISPKTITPDSYAMQANDSTAFVFGSTASNKAPTNRDYTTAHDTTKSANTAKTLTHEMLGKESRIDPNKERKNNQEEPEESQESKTTTESHPTGENNSSTTELTRKSVMIVLSHGVV